MVHLSKKIISIPLICSLFLGLPLSPSIHANVLDNEGNNDLSEIGTTIFLSSSPSFKDIDLATEAGRSLQKLVDLEVLHGFPDNTIKPNGTLTREQAAKILTLLTSKEPALDMYTSHFKDVAKDGWATPYISFSNANGYMQGTPENLFLGQNELTRGQMAVILANFFDYNESYQTANTFTDVATEAYYHDAVYALVERGITMGTSATTFSPEAPVTRAQIAIFFDRSGLLDELLFLQDGIVWDSFPRNWVAGDELDIYDLFGGYLTDYYSVFGPNDESVEIDYSVIGTEWENESVAIQNIQDGTIIPIKHVFYNHFTGVYTPFLVHLEIKNNKISRYKFEFEEDIWENFTESEGLAKFDVFIDTWAELNDVSSRENLELFLINEDIRYYASLSNTTIPHFIFPDEKSFYVALADMYGDAYVFLKIKPTLTNNGYDISFESADPTYQLVIENKNNRQTDYVLVEEDIAFNYYVTDDGLLYFDIYADADSNNAFKEGDTVTINLYDVVDVFDEYEKYIGYEYHDDFLTFMLENGKFVLISEFSSVTFNEYIEEDHYFENDYLEE